MCRLGNDNLVITHVDIRNLSNHRLGSDHFFGKRDEKQRGPISRVTNLYTQIL